MRRTGLVTDARVLQETFIPHEVVHRDNQVNALSTLLKPFVDGEQSNDAFLYGPSGAGKTCITRYVLERLKEEVIDLRTAYVNCWEQYNRFRVLYSILDEVGKTVDIHRRSTPKDELLARLQDLDSRPFIVVLDEIDQLEEEDVLYDLYQMPHVTMIMIANEEHAFFSNLEERVRSRLMNARRIHFDRYSTAALVSILQDRVEWGLKHDAVEESVLELVAEEAAGDARIAIGILRNAAQHAAEQNQEEITEEILAEAVPAANQEQKEKDLEKLNPDQEILYEILEEHGEVPSGDLYTRYEKQMDEPKSKRTLRQYLQKMVHYNLIEADGEKRGRTYTTATQ